MNKHYRRTQILELLRHEKVATQGELRRKLAKRGLHVTQATVSRDIEELGLVKTREGYRVPEGLEAPALAPPHLPVLLREFMREVKTAANLVIVKTHPGNAHTVGAVLDAFAWPEIVGTVAGDDTIMVATPGTAQATRVAKRISGLVAS
jgi:transcriptional regulator of arginine metabolism